MVSQPMETLLVRGVPPLCQEKKNQLGAQYIKTH